MSTIRETIVTLEVGHGERAAASFAATTHDALGGTLREDVSNVL